MTEGSEARIVPLLAIPDVKDSARVVVVGIVMTRDLKQTCLRERVFWAIEIAFL